MADVTHQQIMLKLAEIEQKMATKTDLKALGDRLERKIDHNRAVNVKHHLETRAEIGYLNRKIDGLRSALAHAADPVD